MKSLANEFFLLMENGAKAHQKAHAADYDLIANGIKDELDVSKQIDLVEQMIRVAAGEPLSLQCGYVSQFIHDHLAALNIRLQIVEAHASVRELLRAEGFEQQVGQINRFISVADAVDSFRQSTDHS